MRRFRKIPGGRVKGAKSSGRHYLPHAWILLCIGALETIGFYVDIGIFDVEIE